MRVIILWSILAVAVAASAAAVAAVDSSVESVDDIQVKVTLDAGEESGNAEATVRMHATPEVIWPLITTCADAVRLVPGMTACEVLSTAPDQSWQLIRHVMKYSWLVPTLRYEVRASYERPDKVSLERVAGDIRSMHSNWDLHPQGDYTVGFYHIDVQPGIWVPHWLVRLALRRDLPAMLRALRTRAELLQQAQH